MSDSARSPQVEMYRYPDPPSCFSKEQVAYIESVHSFLDEQDLRWLRDFERFRLNVSFNSLVSTEIPGLRQSPHDVVVYIKRFCDAPYIEMSHRFLDLVLDPSYGREVRKYVMRPYRITLPNGDRYYAFTIGTDPETWRRRFRSAIERLQTSSGEFDRGLFVVTLEDVDMGEVYTFGTLKIDVAEPDDLDAW